MTLLAPDVPENRAGRDRAPDWVHVVLAPLHPPAAGSLRHQRDRVEHRLRGPSLLPHVIRGLLAAGLVEHAGRADLVELQWPEYAHLAPILRRSGVTTPLVVLEHDVAAEAARRAPHAPGDAVDRLSGTLLGWLHRRRERAALQCADLVLVFKSADEALLQRMGVTTPMLVLDPWLDPPAPSYDQRDPRTVLFTGALWRYENDRGAQWLVEEVWPRVVSRVEDARLVLAGDRPTASLRAAAESATGVLVTGHLPDLEPAYQQAGVFAAPLFTGGGLKFKVPQAMTHRLPVVTTTIGAEGITEVAPPGVLWAVTDDPAEFAGALVTALTDSSAAAEVGRRAADWCTDHFSFERSGEELLRTYARLTGSGPGGGGTTDSHTER